MPVQNFFLDVATPTAEALDLMAKKVFTHKVKLPGSSEIVTIPIYADERGQWKASVGIDSHDTADLGELRTWITKIVKLQRAPHIEYLPFIEIFQVKHVENSYRYATPSASIMFRFEVVLLSKDTYEETNHSYEGDKVSKFRLKKFAKVIADSKVVEDTDRKPDYDKEMQRDEEYSDDGINAWSRIIPFTPKRYQAVLAIRDKIEELRARLDNLLVQSDEATKSLDLMPTMALLSAVK